ncbi:acyltransferase [Bradyrhizobium liaoningense]|uniref:acyltransferase family protein n=1 Tax=Bradyrhizobium liaoningense TaxID=43992 RepID=UPI001BA8CA59|nr:acyltransferase [Bradyrhizobium liaoningense]MBR0903885.1 acyltransferase family protein [Bradyrhizobium liaoningense]
MIFLDAVKALAILLVTQSHLKDFYPIRELATGGLLGNCLFFFASSYAIAAGLGKNPEPFGAWYVRRLVRIYIPLWTVMIALVAFRYVPVETVWETGSAFLFPEMYWFLPSIAVLYVPCYFLIRDGTERTLWVSAVAVISAYATTYLVVVDFSTWNAEDHVVLKTIFYFGIMIAGIYLAKFDPPQPAKLGPCSLVALTLAYFLFLAMLRASGLYALQAGANVLAGLWVIAVYNTLRDSRCEAVVAKYLAVPVKGLSNLTLHIYLVQVPLIASFGLERVVFPFNVLLLAVILISAASILYRATSSLLASLPLTRRRIACAL